eukprot:1188806-Prorocentrum_minimum.AAC.1
MRSVASFSAACAADKYAGPLPTTARLVGPARGLVPRLVPGGVPWLDGQSWHTRAISCAAAACTEVVRSLRLTSPFSNPFTNLILPWIFSGSLYNPTYVPSAGVLRPAFARSGAGAMSTPSRWRQKRPRGRRSYSLYEGGFRIRRIVPVTSDGAFRESQELGSVWRERGGWYPGRLGGARLEVV